MSGNELKLTLTRLLNLEEVLKDSYILKYLQPKTYKIKFRELSKHPLLVETATEAELKEILQSGDLKKIAKYDEETNEISLHLSTLSKIVLRCLPENCPENGIEDLLTKVHSQHSSIKMDVKQTAFVFFEDYDKCVETCKKLTTEKLVVNEVEYPVHASVKDPNSELRTQLDIILAKMTHLNPEATPFLPLLSVVNEQYDLPSTMATTVALTCQPDVIYNDPMRMKSILSEQDIMNRQISPLTRNDKNEKFKKLLVQIGVGSCQIKKRRHSRRRHRHRRHERGSSSEDYYFRRRERRLKRRERLLNEFAGEVLKVSETSDTPEANYRAEFLKYTDEEVRQIIKTMKKDEKYQIDASIHEVLRKPRLTEDLLSEKPEI